MSHLSALILGIVEGITEFLPISSTGHLVLTAQLLQIPSSPFVSSFEIAIQLGAICAVVGRYLPRLIRDFHLWIRLIIAFIPTGLVGLLAYPLIKSLLANPTTILWALGIGGVVIILFEKIIHEKADSGEDISKLPLKTAFLVGVAQSVSVIPGVSRAAATICGGMAVGMSRRAIVEFSFLLAIPTMVVATGFDLIKNAGAFGAGQWSVLAIGAIAAWLTARVAMKWLIGYIQHHDFTVFGIYRIAVAFIGAFILR